MPTYMLRDLPESLLGRLRAYAERHDLGLRAAILAILTRGLNDYDARVRGGRARADSQTAAERSALATRAVHARIARRDP